MKKHPFLITLSILSLICFLQAANLFPIVIKQLKEIKTNYWQSVLWRSANYAYNQQFAEYQDFLNAEIPSAATVLIPPQDAAPKIFSHPYYMMFFLLPRQIAKCDDVSYECAANFREKNAYLLIMDDYPPSTLLEDKNKIRMFNKKWGVYLPPQPETFPDHQIQPSVHLNLRQILIQLFLFMAWLLPLGLAGFLITHFTFHDKNWLFKTAIGYGVGLFLLTMELTIASMFGIVLSKGVIIALSILPLLLSILIFLLIGYQKKTPLNASLLSLIKDLTLPNSISKADLLWSSVFGLFALLAAAIGVGHSYAKTDEIILWGLLGYKIALHNSIEIEALNYFQKVLYPFHVPLLIASSKILFNDTLPHAKLFFSGYYFSLLLAIYAVLPGRVKYNILSGLAVCILATFPVLFDHASLSYANLPFAYYFSLAVWLLILARAKIHSDSRLIASKSQIFSLWISGLFFAASAWTRPEGLYIIFITLFLLFSVILWETKQWKSCLIFLNVVFPILLYMIFFAIFHQHMSVHLRAPNLSDEISIRTITHQVSHMITNNRWNLQSLIYILHFFINQSLSFQSWGYVGIALIFSLFLLLLTKWSKQTLPFKTILASGWLVIIIMLLYYYIISLFPLGAKDLSFWLNIGLDRMAMPALILIWSGTAAFWLDYLISSKEQATNENA